MKRVLLAVCAILALSCVARAQTVIQTVSAWQGENPLPRITGQATSQAQCAAVIATNLAAAPSFGYTVDDAAGTFTDPVSGITIKQGCVEAAPWFDPNPVHPFSGPAPVVSPIEWSIGVCTEVILTIGQSNGASTGRGRHTARSFTWSYAGRGAFYALSDPMPGLDGTDASPWPRMADLIFGKPHIDPTVCPPNAINRVIIAGRNIAGSCIRQWAPGGDLNGYLAATIQDMLTHGLTPTRILWHQGECESPPIPLSGSAAASSAYQQAFAAMVASIRRLGVTAPIYVATATLCDMRDASNPSIPDRINRDARYYVEREIARLAVRHAQQAVVNGTDVRAGPNTDTIDWRLRAAGDGCHGDERFLWEHAKRWAIVLTGVQ